MPAAFDPDVLAALNGWVIDGRYADDHVDATQETARQLVELATSVPRARPALNNVVLDAAAGVGMLRRAWSGARRSVVRTTL